MSDHHAESRILPRQVFELLDALDTMVLKTIADVRPGLSDDAGGTVESLVLDGAMILFEVGPLSVGDEDTRTRMRWLVDDAYPDVAERPGWVTNLAEALNAGPVPDEVSARQLGATAADVFQGVLAKRCNRLDGGSYRVDELRVFSQWYEPKARSGGDDPVAVRITPDGVAVIAARDALDLLVAADQVVARRTGGDPEAGVEALGHTLERVQPPGRSPSANESALRPLRAQRLSARIDERQVDSEALYNALEEMALSATTKLALSDDREKLLEYLLAAGCSDQELIRLIDELPVAETSTA